jgi:dTDP-4-dehydrorhamnose 3,5-epimerase
VQSNHSLSLRRGTVRGLHYQLPPAGEVKVLRCVRGAVQDVMVDLRQGSPTFLRWHAEVLTDDNLKMVYVPAGFAHGFQALEGGSAVTYQSSASYSAAHERGVRHDDPRLTIRWLVSEAVVSPKDAAWPDLDPSFPGVPAESSPGRPRGQKRPPAEGQDAPEDLAGRLARLEAENAHLRRLVDKLRSPGPVPQAADR